jgi:phosphoserine phosphatase
VTYHSGGQGPIFRFRAADGAFERYRPTCFPLGAMALASPRPPGILDLAPGDILVLLSDGFYEQLDPAGEEFGEARVEALVRQHHAGTVAALRDTIVRAVAAHASGTPQADDMTAVLLKRTAAAAGLARMFGRSFA